MRDGSPESRVKYARSGKYDLANVNSRTYDATVDIASRYFLHSRMKYYCIRGIIILSYYHY